MAGWHHRLDGHKFGQALAGSEAQGNLARCSPWGHKESDTTERLNNSLENWTGKDSEAPSGCLGLVMKVFSWQKKGRHNTPLSS